MRETTATIATTGIGKPDYSKEISLGQVRPGLSLKYLQSLKNFSRTYCGIPSPYAFVTAPMAPGEITHAIDSETDLELPFTVPAGFTLMAISASASFSQDCIIWMYLDGFVVGTLGTPIGGSVYYVPEIVGPGTHLIDPTGAISHTFDITLTNLGGDNLVGGASLFLILEAVGTPPLPKIKTVHCKWCGHEYVVPVETERVICPNCGELFIVYNLRKIRRTP